ncbi:hypothetical protein D9M68_867320 [compost metagenome]
MQHALRCIQLGFFFCLEAYLLRPPFSGHILAVEPGILEPQRAIAMHFRLDVFQNGQHIVFLTKRNPKHWSYTLGEAEIGIRIQQHQRLRRTQLASSSWIPIASTSEMSIIC